jgi:hypothetical protein
MGSVTIQRAGADLLANLALNRYSQIQIVHKQGIELFIRSIDHHFETPSVIERCMSALWNISAYGIRIIFRAFLLRYFKNLDQNQERIASRKGLETIAKVAKHYDTYPAVILATCGVIRNLSLNCMYPISVFLTNFLIRKLITERLYTS